MSEAKFTKAQLTALHYATSRPRGNFCPIPGLGGMIRAAAATALLNALDRKGCVVWDGAKSGGREGGIPRISDAGRAHFERATREALGK